jgi:DNA topoisomerase-3
LGIPFKTVILCEKPNQALMFKKILGLNTVHSISGLPSASYDAMGGVCVLSLSGHILELMPPEFYEKSLSRSEKGWNLDALPVIPVGKRWPLRPKVGRTPQEKKRVAATLAAIKWAMIDLGSPGEISLAVDNDDEGELLGWETLEYFKLLGHPNFTRVLFSEINPKSMKAAFDIRSDASVWYTRYLVGLARQYADWLIGMNVTMAMTLDNKEFIPPSSPLNSGRVVYAISYLLYLRSEAINNYIPIEHYSEKVDFSVSDGVMYRGKLQYPVEFVDAESGLLVDKVMAEKVHAYVQKIGEGVVSKYDQENKSTNAPIGFHRTGFDRHIIKKFGLSLDEIGKAMQSLYDAKGVITYPRVDVKYLDEGMHQDMGPYIKALASNLLTASQLSEQERALYGKVFQVVDLGFKSSIWKKGIAEGESHHAIITTTQVCDVSKMTNHEFLIYREIADRLLCQFLPSYEYASTIIETTIGRFICKTTGSVPLKRGWKALSSDLDEELDEDENGLLPVLVIGQKVKINNTITSASTTKEPKHYTIDELLKDTENPRSYVFNKEMLPKIRGLKIGTDGTRPIHITSLKKKGFVIEQKRKGSKKVVELIPTKKLLQLLKVAPGYFKYPEVSAYWEDAFTDIKKGKMPLEAFIEKQSVILKRFFVDLRTGAFRFSEPIIDNYKICELCQGYLYHTTPKGKDYSLWRCGRCDTAFFDKNGEIGEQLKRGVKGSGGARVDWVPPSGTPRLKCGSCTTGDAYYRKVEGKSWSLWECVSCRDCFFDNKGELGKKMEKKKK